MSGASEVKGAYFCTARAYVEDVHGHDRLKRLVASMPVAHRAVMADPLPSSWYPEEALRDALEAFHEVVAEGDDQRFGEMMEECVRRGTHRFFRALLAITSPSFLLRSYPAVVSVLRRGPSRVQIEPRERDTLVRHVDLPFADDPRYQITGSAGLRSILQLTTRRSVQVSVVRAAPTLLELSVAMAQPTRA